MAFILVKLKTDTFVIYLKSLFNLNPCYFTSESAKPRSSHGTLRTAELYSQRPQRIPHFSLR
jgi:hypothetical protein